MGSHATQVSSGSSAAATAYRPERIMLLAPDGGGKDQACNVTGDSETIAAGSTSSGHYISVSLRREPSPTLSRICLRFRHGTARRPAAYSTVVAAAHGGSFLLRIVTKECFAYEKIPATGDYFVYNAGAAATADASALPPSLYLLPPFTSAKRWWECLDLSATGLVCCGKAEFVVAQLKMVWVNGDAGPKKAAELLLFRDGHWRVKRPRIVHDHGEDGDMFVALWEPQAVVPLGDDGRLLCWVDFSRGVVFSDVLGDHSPVLRYVPYPMEATNSGGPRKFDEPRRQTVKL